MNRLSVSRGCLLKVNEELAVGPQIVAYQWRAVRACGIVSCLLRMREGVEELVGSSIQTEVALRRRSGLWIS